MITTREQDAGSEQVIKTIDFHGSRDFCVYAHIFPDGKMYIGATKNKSKRWRNGEGYLNNKEMYNAIQMFGWNNIQHEIVSDHLSLSQARELERSLIKLFNSTDNGYNKAKGGDGLLGYLNKHCAKVIQLMDQYSPLFDDNVVLLRDVDGCEEDSEKINNADYQMRTKWNDEYISLMHADSLMFLGYWWRNLVFILSGEKIDDIKSFCTVGARYLEERLG